MPQVGEDIESWDIYKLLVKSKTKSILATSHKAGAVYSLKPNIIIHTYRNATQSVSLGQLLPTYYQPLHQHFESHHPQEGFPYKGKNLPAMQGIRVRFLGWEDPL